MKSDTNASDSSTDSSSRVRCAEDPRRERHEKETALHLEGDSTRFSVTSFKRVIYKKLLQRPNFHIKHLHVLDDDGEEHTVDCFDEAVERSLTTIGVTGQIPVGSIHIGVPRNTNSPARIVK
jgi:hypothetical protein